MSLRRCSVSIALALAALAGQACAGEPQASDGPGATAPGLGSAPPTSSVDGSPPSVPAGGGEPERTQLPHPVSGRGEVAEFQRPRSTPPIGTSTPEVKSLDTFGSAPDPAGDAGAGAPAYADLRQATLQDEGSQARIVIEMAGALPQAPGEPMTAGVDLYADDDSGRGSSIFASGTSDGWVAHSSTHNGATAFVGTFAVNGTRFIFDVPWSALDEMKAGRFASFVEWTSQGAEGSDRAPDGITAQYGS